MAGQSRRFTLLQLLVAAGCVVPLGALGFAYWSSTRCVVYASEAISMLQGIRGAEEAFRADFETYAGCTEKGLETQAGDLASAAWFPREKRALNASKLPFDDRSTEVGRCFQLVGVRADGPVRCSYALSARGGEKPTFEAAAVCDRDGDGDRAEYRTSSASYTVETIDEQD